jgi:predicted nucleotidyltransferase
LSIPNDKVAELCRKWRVRELSLFGSVLRGDFSPESDVDVLVSFEESAPWSLWDLLRMREELQNILGRDVDLIEREGLRNPFRRHRILSSRRVIWEIKHDRIWRVATIHIPELILGLAPLVPPAPPDS